MRVLSSLTLDFLLRHAIHAVLIHLLLAESLPASLFLERTFVLSSCVDGVGLIVVVVYAGLLWYSLFKPPSILIAS